MTPTMVRGADSQQRQYEQPDMNSGTKNLFRRRGEVNVRSSSSEVAGDAANDAYNLMNELQSYRSFDPGWDGDESEPITSAVIGLAMSLLSKLSAEVTRGKLNWHSPDISPVPDGSISLYWSVKSRWIQVRILPGPEKYQLISGASGRPATKKMLSEYDTFAFVTDLLRVN